MHVKHPVLVFILYSNLNFALFEPALSTCNIKVYIYYKVCMPQKFLGKFIVFILQNPKEVI